jgi:protein-disulfide isomerase
MAVAFDVHRPWAYGDAEQIGVDWWYSRQVRVYGISYPPDLFGFRASAAAGAYFTAPFKPAIQMAQNRKTAGNNAVASSKSSKKPFYIGMAVAAIAGIAALSYITGKASKNRIITVDPNLPSVESQGYVMGSPDAKVELVEHGDFECPGCGQYAELTEPEIRAQYVNAGKIRFRFIDYPLSGHQNTLNASNAAACADEQGKFWEMHDLIYGTQYEWSSLSKGPSWTDPDKHFKKIARQIPGLDASKFDECVTSRRMMAKVQAHLRVSESRGVRSTPTFFLGNQMFGGMAVDQLKRTLDAAIAAAEATPATKTTKKP